MATDDEVDDCDGGDAIGDSEEQKSLPLDFGTEVSPQKTGSRKACP